MPPGRPRVFLLGGGLLLLVFLTLTVRGAGPVVLAPQWLTLPASTGRVRFADVDGDGRADLLVLDPGEKNLLNYHQRPEGFPNAPDQAIPLPPRTIWVTAFDVEAHPGLELLMSTATGLAYSRQNRGQFELEQRPLLQATQVFTNFDFPFLVLLSTNKPGTNDLIPVISARQAVTYHRDSAYEWRPGPALPLNAEKADWSVRVEPWADPWTLGPNPAHRLHVHQSLRVKPDQWRYREPEEEAIRKIVTELKKTAEGPAPEIDRTDVDGDGREDLVLCQRKGNPIPKTDLLVFLRGSNGRLPERPSQVLHCRGFPIPIGSTLDWSPVYDLNGDGIGELVLLEFKTSVTSVNGVVEVFFSRGIDWALTIRTFQRGAFSGSPDAAVLVKGMLPPRYLDGWSTFIQGDFNGDGRLDLLVRRTESEWHVFFSTTDGRWFAPQPALTFDTSPQGYMEIKDLNGDGLSDIVWHEPDAHRLAIFMSPSRQPKGSTP